MTTLAPIASCAQWHPGVPSEIQLTAGIGPRGKAFQRRLCSVCRAYMARARHKSLAYPLSAHEPYGIALGVAALNWTPPERLLEHP